MGFLKRAAKGFTADGCREAMLDSYAKHVKLALKGGIDVEASSPHFAGLYGALASRYRAWGERTDEGTVWLELAPFLLMDAAVAPKALAEYVLYKERPKAAKVAWLREQINGAIRNTAPSPDSLASGLARAALLQPAWLELLDGDVMEAIEEEWLKIEPE
jgi:hypothetical protein